MSEVNPADSAPVEVSLDSAWDLVRILAHEDPAFGFGLRAYAARDSVSVAEAVREVLATISEAGYEWLESLSPEARRRAYRVLDSRAVVSRPQPKSMRRSAKKARYLEALKDTCNMTTAQQAVGISSSLPYIWAKSDPEFKARWNEARMFAGLEPWRE